MELLAAYLGVFFATWVTASLLLTVYDGCEEYFAYVLIGLACGLIWFLSIPGFLIYTVCRCIDSFLQRGFK